MAFTVEIKQGNAWQTVKAIYPLTIGELLDERLDEANVVFYSTVASYKPLTEVRITFGTGDTEYFIIANDASAEYPAGSGKYKHEAYLIERTKLLEGILCQSLTFTNTKETIRSLLTGNTIPMKDVEITDDGDTVLPPYYTNDSIITPAPISLEIGKQFTLPSAEEVAEAFCEQYLLIVQNGSASTLLREFRPLEDVYIDPYHTFVSQTEVIEGSSTTIYTYATAPTITPSQDFEIRYTVVAQGYTADNTPEGNPFKATFTLTVLVAENNYPLRPYSITDCINRVLELAEPIRRGERPRYSFSGVMYDSNGDANPYGSGTEAAKYDKVRAPEFTLTQSTLREQLRTIGSYIHAEPYLDENNVIHFLEYGNTEEESIDAPYISNTATWSINQYCTEIRSNAQNLTSSLGYAKGAKIEPAPSLYTSIKTEQQYARVDDTNGYCATTDRIYDIIEIKCGVADGSSTINGWAVVDGVTLSPKPITQFVFEQTRYDANLASKATYPRGKNWALYYTIGQAGIRGLTYRASSAVTTAEPFAIANILSVVNSLSPRSVDDYLQQHFSNLVFQITYKPIASAFVSHGKQEYVEGEQLYTLAYNQSDNLVETEYYGENMKGVAARMGNIEKERTFILRNRASIPRVGYMLDGYAISAVSCEYYPSYIKCTVGLTKDFNRISEYIGINSMKRMYEVSERQSQEREILIKETLLITDDTTATNDSGVLLQSVSGVLDACNSQAYTDTETVVKYATVQTRKKDDTTPLTSWLNLPVAARSFGNSIHFAFRFKDNYSAGTKSEWVTDTDVQGRWQMDIPYTDYYGRAYWLRFGLRGGAVTTTDEYAAKNAFTLPQPTGGYSTPDEAVIADTLSTPIRLRKDNREIISLNYELEYKTDVPDLIIGSALAARCRYINNFDTDACIVFATNVNPNKFARSVNLNDVISSPSPAHEIVGNSLELNLSSTFSGYKYWVLATNPREIDETYIDEDGNTVTERVQTGLKVLLAGSIEALGENRSKTFKFVIKK